MYGDAGFEIPTNVQSTLDNIGAAYQKRDTERLDLSDEEWEWTGAFFSVFSRIAYFAPMLCANGTNVVIPALVDISALFAEFRKDDSLSVRTIGEIAADHMEFYLRDPHCDELYVVAMLLDPRQKRRDVKGVLRQTLVDAVKKRCVKPASNNKLAAAVRQAEKFT